MAILPHCYSYETYHWGLLSLYLLYQYYTTLSCAIVYIRLMITDLSKFQIGGKRVGIIGLGSIGYLVAKRLEAFGCHITYNSRKKKPNIPYPFYENIIELAKNSDALIICCALTEETHHMINKDVMLALGKEGMIVNVGRGALIDERELVSCLVKRDIGGAGLDVFENEPHVPKELFDLDNVVLSPHKAVATPESIVAVQQVVIANLKAFFANKPLLSEVKLD